jgi:NADPH-dependent F420 reductase
MILVDVTVPLVIEKGFFTVQETVFESGAERIQKELGNKAVVAAAFKTISAHALAELDHPMDCDDFVACDDKDVRAEIIGIGKMVKNVRPLDAGPLKSCRVIERMTGFLINMNKRYKVKDSGFRVTM